MATLTSLKSKLEKLKAKDSELNDELIAAGKGHLRLSEILKGTDSLSLKVKKLKNEIHDVEREIDQLKADKVMAIYRKKYNTGVMVNTRRNKSRKSVRRNPLARSAREMAEQFHGRKVRNEIIIDEIYKEPSDFAVIGDLQELVVTPLQESKYEYPINFEKQNSSEAAVVEVCCDAEGKQIYFVGGDQNLDDIIPSLELTDSLTQNFIVLGYCHMITYFTDKHHLEGDDEQQYGVPYEHEFGEQGGTWPVLIYDQINKKIMLSGGTYEVRDVGIWN